MAKVDSVRSRDLKTVCKNVGVTAASVNLGGQVPAGMKRYVTFLCVSPTQSAVGKSCCNAVLYLGSVVTAYPTAASCKLVTHRKRTVLFQGLKMSCTNTERPLMIPNDGPDPDSPLFSIAASKYIGASASVHTVNVFMQYFDE